MPTFIKQLIFLFFIFSFFPLFLPTQAVATIESVNDQTIGLIDNLKKISTNHGNGEMSSDLGFDRDKNADVAFGGNWEKDTVFGIIDGFGKRGHMAANILKDAIIQTTKTSNFPTSLSGADADTQPLEGSGACMSLVTLSTTPWSHEIQPQPGRLIWKTHTAPDERSGATSPSAICYANIIHIGDTQVIIYRPSTDNVLFDTSRPPEDLETLTSYFSQHPTSTWQHKFLQLADLFVGDQPVCDCEQPSHKYHALIGRGTFMDETEKIWRDYLKEPDGSVEDQPAKSFTNNWQQVVQRYASSKHANYIQHGVFPRDYINSAIGRNTKEPDDIQHYKDIPLLPDDMVFVLSDGIGDPLTTEEFLGILKPLIKQSSLGITPLSQQLADVSDMRAYTASSPVQPDSLPIKETRYFRKRLFHLEKQYPHDPVSTVFDANKIETMDISEIMNSIYKMEPIVSKKHGLSHKYHTDDSDKENNFIFPGKDDNRSFVIFRVGNPESEKSDSACAQ